LKRTLRITVERSRTPRRMWLKAVDNTGLVILVRNIDVAFAADERNRLAEKLSDTGEFDEVLADTIPPYGQASRKESSELESPPATAISNGGTNSINAVQVHPQPKRAMGPKRPTEPNRRKPN
jgi:hypothetical protein